MPNAARSALTASVPAVPAQEPDAGLLDALDRADRWHAAAGIPVDDREVPGWLDNMGLPVPTGIRTLMHAIRSAVISAGEVGYRYGLGRPVAAADDSVSALEPGDGGRLDAALAYHRLRMRGASTVEECAEALSEMLGDWYAAWPDSAVTDPHGPNQRPACADPRVHPDTWYWQPPDTAQRICAECPLRQPCAEWAIRTRQRFGVWGGMTPRDRSQHT